MLRYDDAYEVVWDGCPGPTGHGDELLADYAYRATSSSDLTRRYGGMDPEVRARLCQSAQARAARARAAKAAAQAIYCAEHGGDDDARRD